MNRSVLINGTVRLLLSVDLNSKFSGVSIVVLIRPTMLILSSLISIRKLLGNADVSSFSSSAPTIHCAIASELILFTKHVLPSLDVKSVPSAFSKVKVKSGLEELL